MISVLLGVAAAVVAAVTLVATILQQRSVEAERIHTGPVPRIIAKGMCWSCDCERATGTDDGLCDTCRTGMISRKSVDT